VVVVLPTPPLRFVTTMFTAAESTQPRASVIEHDAAGHHHVGVLRWLREIER
jgi:hypothetical protein